MTAVTIVLIVFLVVQAFHNFVLYDNLDEFDDLLQNVLDYDRNEIHRMFAIINLIRSIYMYQSSHSGNNHTANNIYLAYELYKRIFIHR